MCLRAQASCPLGCIACVHRAMALDASFDEEGHTPVYPYCGQCRICGSECGNNELWICYCGRGPFCVQGGCAAKHVRKHHREPRRRQHDTSAVHLHYHKKGSLDDPVLVDPIPMPQNANSGASQPTAPFIALSPSQPNIGRREALLALTSVLNACWNTGPGAVDITDGHAFDWKRFFANTMERFEIEAMELEKVFALRRVDSEPPELALCTTGTSWKVMEPTQKNYKNTRRPALRDMSSNWRTEPLLLQAGTLDRNWMRTR